MPASQNISRRNFVAAGSFALMTAGLAACGNDQASSGSAPKGTVSVSKDEPEKAPVEDQPASEPERDPELEPSVVDRLLATMTIEQKVAQMFMVTPEQLTGTEVATVAGSMTERALAEIPVGGLVYFGQNITGNQQLRNLLSGSLELSRGAGAGIPAFLGVDEEGGKLVARVANSGHFDVQHFPNMADIGATGNPARAAEVGSVIGTYLREIGFNLDFAPDADVLTNPENPVIGVRSFGSDPALVASMVAAEVEAMNETGVAPCVKHFPGHGDTAGDSHTGAVYTERTLEQLQSCEFGPFRAAIEANVPFVMVGHIETPNAAGDGLPASLSPVMMQDILRGDLGFDGVIISDSFAMGAITENFTPDEAAVQFFTAGGDMLLMTADLKAAYNGVLEAVNAGTLTEDRIDESVRRILTAKEQMGLIA